MRMAREGVPALAFISFMIAGSLYFAPPVALFLAPLLPFVFWFYRDPERQPDGEGCLSPVDGVVTGIESGEYPSVGKAMRISLATALTDAHVLRSPCSGRVDRLVRFPRKLPIGTPSNAARRWERVVVELSTDCGPILIAHTAGFPGRNVVCRLARGSWLERGGGYGIIPSLARTEIYLPPGTDILVEEGRRVFAGKTVLGFPAAGSEVNL